MKKLALLDVKYNEERRNLIKLADDAKAEKERFAEVNTSLSNKVRTLSEQIEYLIL